MAMGFAGGIPHQGSLSVLGRQGPGGAGDTQCCNYTKLPSLVSGQEACLYLSRLEKKMVMHKQAYEPPGGRRR